MSKRSKAAEAMMASSAKTSAQPLKSFVRSENDGAVVVVTLRDPLKEETALRLVQLQVTNLIDDQELGTSEIVDSAMEFVFSQRCTTNAASFQWPR